MKDLRHKALNPLTVVYRQGEKLGIDNVKSILTILITFFVDLYAVIKTRNYIRVLETVWGLMRFGNIIDIAKEAWEEFQDLDQAESQELYLHFAMEFDIENDQVEALIEQAVSTIPRIYQLALDSLAIVGRGRDIFYEVRALFGKDGEIEQLAAHLNKAA